MSTTGKQLFTTLESNGTLTVAIEEVSFPDPTGNKVLVKMEAGQEDNILRCLTWINEKMQVRHLYSSTFYIFVKITYKNLYVY